MGTRVVPTPSSPRKRGCSVKFATLAAVPLLMVGLTAAACDNSQPTTPSKSEQAQTQYRNCVGADHRKATQDRCQRHVWGQTFGEDDPRWDCGHMGNWACGPTRKDLGGSLMDCAKTTGCILMPLHDGPCRPKPDRPIPDVSPVGELKARLRALADRWTLAESIDRWTMIDQLRQELDR